MITLSPSLRRIFGLRRSWNWAMRNMKRGSIVTRGGYLYRFDMNTLLIEWLDASRGGTGWKPAKMFYDDFRSVEWRVEFKKPML